MRQPSPSPSVELSRDLAACRALLRQGSRTFYAASFLLPHSVRTAACALYAFCRVADDAIDLSDDRAGALHALRDRLARVYQGQPLPIAADRAFADVVVRYRVSRALPEALLEGFEWDAANRRYDDLDELTQYAARVAGTVGVMMAVLMGARSPEALARACDLGVAMQFSNIARDVGEDARAGRLYLPRNWLRQVGIDPQAWMAAPVFSPELARVVERLLAEADRLYERAAGGISLLPRPCRPGISAARFLYAEIGKEVARRGFDSVGCRARVSGIRKARKLAQALLVSTLGSRPICAEVLPGCEFLVQGAASSLAAASPAYSGAALQAFSTPDERVLQERRPDGALGGAAAPWWNLHGRAVWVIHLFERLERMERTSRVGPMGRLS